MPAIRQIIALAGGLFALLSLGCGPSHDWSTGVWKGDRQLAGEDPAMMRTLSKVELTLRPEGRFELIESGLSGAGRWQSEGDYVWLDLEEMLRRPISPRDRAEMHPIELRWLGDDRLEYRNPNGFTPTSVILKRETKPVPTPVRTD